MAASLITASALTGAAEASSSALGTPDPAQGAPVAVGIITDTGGGSGGTGALVEAGAKMAVSYANAYEKGLDGHKINLYICENQATPAGGQTCANDMVQKGVVAVVLPFTGQGATEVPTITKAGIPYITLSGASDAELTTPGAFKANISAAIQCREDHRRQRRSSPAPRSQRPLAEAWDRPMRNRETGGAY